MIDIEAIFEGAVVPEWLEHFQDEPLVALQDLLVGGADLGMLSADDPTSVLLDWLEGLGAKSGFPVQVDQTLALERDYCAWGQPVLEAAGSATMTAVAWCRAADVIAMDERLDRAAGRSSRPCGCDRVFLGLLLSKAGAGTHKGGRGSPWPATSATAACWTTGGVYAGSRPRSRGIAAATASRGCAGCLRPEDSPARSPRGWHSSAAR